MVGFVAVAISLYTLQLLPLRSMALVMIIASFAMFVLEAKLQTHGIAGTGGIVLMVIGALLLVDRPFPEMRVHLWAALSVAVPIGIITVFLITIALKARRNKVVTGAQGMIGEVAIVCPAHAFRQGFRPGQALGAVSPAHVDARSRVVVHQVKEPATSRGTSAQEQCLSPRVPG